MGKVQSQLRDDESLLSPRRRSKSVTAGGMEKPFVPTSPRKRSPLPTSPKNRPHSLHLGRNNIVQLITSPRSRTHTHQSDRFYGDVPRIDPDEMEIFEHIGWGASGVIKRGAWNGRPVAVKFLFPHARLAQIQAELSHWGAIRHPNVVELLGAYSVGGEFAIVMEFLPEGDLSSYLRTVDLRKPGTLPLLYRVAVDVARAMLHVHTTNCRMHRDLKAKNILLNCTDSESNEPVAKICDFGDIRIVGTDMTPKVGTVSYMAPEVLSAEPYTNKADVYSYGMLLWEIISRKEPFSENDFMHEIVEKVQAGFRPKLPPYCPKDVASLINDCWHPDPDVRPDFRRVLRRLGDIGQLWDQSEVEKILLADQSDPSDNDWELTTDNESDWGEENEIKGSLRSSEEEQTLRPRLPPLRRTSNSKNLPVARHSKRSSKTEDDDDDDYDVSDSDDEESEAFTPPRALEDLLKDISCSTPPTSESERVRRLRELSKGRNNLNRMLSSKNDTSSIDAALLIQVLKTALKRESLRGKELKQNREFLRSRYRKEYVARVRLEQQIRHEELQFERKTSISTDLSEIQSFLQSILAEERLQNLRGEEPTNLKWCEIPFASISPDNSPYRYSFFGIWYKAEWNFAPARLCVAIGGIHRDKIHNFRQVSASVQQITNHPNMCNLVGIVSAKPNFGILYHVQPDSFELPELYQKRTLSMNEKLYILLQVSRAIAFCHSHNRTISWLSNHAVVVNRMSLHTELVHVCELYSFVQRPDSSWENHRWHAPEVWTRNQKTPASDIFSFGLLMWSVLMEREPYNMFSQKTANKISGGWRLPFPASCPKEISQLVKQCWEMKPGDRLQADELESELDLLQKNDYSSVSFDSAELEKILNRRSQLFQSTTEEESP